MQQPNQHHKQQPKQQYKQQQQPQDAFVLPSPFQKWTWVTTRQHDNTTTRQHNNNIYYL